MSLNRKVDPNPIPTGRPRRNRWLPVAALIGSLVGFGFGIDPATGGRFLRFGQRDGMSQLTVRVLLQDREGFLWLGTGDGLNRYDGSTFVVYTHQPDDPDSLAHPMVNCLAEGRHGLWVGTEGGGLSLFDPGRGTFNPQELWADIPRPSTREQITAVFEDAAGRVWVGAHGANLMVRPAGETRWRPVSLPGWGDGDRITVLAADAAQPDRYLWVAGTMGVFRLDTERESLEPWLPSTPDGSLSVLALTQDTQNGVWAAAGQYLYRWDQSGGRGERILPAVGAGASAAPPLLTRLAHEPGPPGQRGILWVGTDGAGLIALNLDTDRQAHFRHDPRQPDSLTDDAIRSLLIDRGGLLWVGTRSQGLNRHLPWVFEHIRPESDRPGGLPDSMVNSLFESHDGSIWVGLLTGAARWRPDRSRFDMHPIPRPAGASVIDSAVWAFAETPDGTLWWGTGNGLAAVHPGDSQPRFFRPDPDQPGSLSGRSVSSLLVDSHGTLWVGTYSAGLDRRDSANGRFEPILNGLELPGLDPTDRHVVDMGLDRDGRVWLAIPLFGVISIDPRDGRRDTYPMDCRGPNRINSMAVSRVRAGPEIWLGTFGGGLTRFFPATGIHQRITTADGLPNNTIYSVVEDENGQIWGGTNRGLFRLDPQTGECRVYTSADGLQADEFNQGVATRGRDGRLYFGGVNGFNVFDPRELRDRGRPPPVAITRFSVFGQPRPLPRPMADDLPEVTLTWPEDHFAFEFAVLDFTDSKRNRHLFTLEGYDRDWIPCMGRRLAAYTGVPGGTYIFRVRGANAEGVWNETGAAVRVRIRGPFWRAPWFPFAVAGAAVLAVLAGFQRRAGRERRRRQELERQVAQRTRDLSAKTAQLEQIGKIVRAINAEFERDDLLRAMLAETCRLTGLTAARALVRQPDDGTFSETSWSDRPATNRPSPPLTPEEAHAILVEGGLPLPNDVYLHPASAGRPGRAVLRVHVTGRVESLLVFDCPMEELADQIERTRPLSELADHFRLAFAKTRLLEELRQLNQTKNEFLGMAAHDLRNPLSGMVNLLRLQVGDLQQGRLDPASLEDDLRQVIGESERMLNLIRELLDLTAIEAGTVHLRRTPADLAALVVERCRFHIRLAEQKGITLQPPTHHQPLPIQADRNRIQEVLDNLLSNAVKYTFTGGQVRVTLAATDTEAQVHVTDTGQGLSDTDQAQLFGFFKRLGARPTGGEPSTGLGLAICKKNIELHGGRIWAVSELGHGSTFSFALPLDTPPSPAPERTTL